MRKKETAGRWRHRMPEPEKDGKVIQDLRKMRKRVKAGRQFQRRSKNNYYGDREKKKQ